MTLRDTLPCSLAFLLFACAADDPDANADAEVSTSDTPATSSPTTSSSTTSTSTTDPATTIDPTGESSEASGTVPRDCTDRMILDLSLVQGTVSEGAVTSEADGEGWRSSIDATAGGLPNAPMNPWVYLRFAEDGMHKVEIDDFAALDSTEWHIAAKRFGIRLNSGPSGPSTIAAAPILDASYEMVDDLPSGALPLEEAFYTEDCTLLDDGSGLGTPGYVMTPWWTYPGCVATTNVPFVIELPEGRLKLVVDTYYLSGQETCNESGAMGTDSANFTWRWAFLP